MRRTFSDYFLAAFALSVALGWGCGGGGGIGAGCGLKPLPSEPAPRGMPSSQQIEGGGQVRITRPGFDKISSVVGTIAKKALMTPMCVPKQQQSLGLGDVSECDAACNGGVGCPVTIKLRPDLVPPDGIQISMKDGTNPVMHIDVAFDVHLPVNVRYKLILGGWNDLCTLNVDSNGTHLNVDIQLGIDPKTGELTIDLANLKIINLNLSASGCSLLGWLVNAVLDFVNVFATSFIGDFIIKLLTPMINNVIQGFLPKPPGLAGILPMGTMLASFDAPADANLEAYMVAGGYVSAFNGGLNLGLITGLNSDRDESTRTPDLVSEPNLCVPTRKTPDLGAAPWMLPLNPPRKDFLLSPAPEFSGMPDPMDMMGNTKDLAIGISRTTMDLAGFHVFNSGTMCLAISGGILSALNAGAIAVLVPSLGNILENRKGPLALVLRPEQPPVFTLGNGSPMDPLIHVGVTDMRIDFYAFIEERYVRLFTIALDMNVGINLSLTTTMDGKPAIQPMITGIDKTSVQARVTNTDLLTEDPQKLAKTLLGLIDVAVGQFMGAIKPVPLPALQGFSLDGLEITRVQTKQDDFLAIYGNLVQDPMMMMAPVPADVVPLERAPRAVATTAEIVDVSVPPPDVIRAAVQADRPDPSNLPSVTLKLGGNRPSLEWTWRIDGDAWRPWSPDAHPTLHDAALLLQAKHVIEVRARERGDWLTEADVPVRLPVIIDSQPPEMAPKVGAGRVSFAGFDNVTDESALRYAWQEGGQWTAYTSRTSLSYDEAWAASENGKQPLTVKCVDEAGNEKIVQLDLAGMEEFHGRTTTPPAMGGCGCTVGGAKRTNDGALALLLLGSIGALGAWRGLRRRSSSRASRSSRAFGALVAVAAAASLNAGCNCGGHAPAGCQVDDDCRAMKCDTGNVPTCADNMCSCAPDVPLGDIGRFSTMAMRGGSAYVAAYNNTYGDLMIGHVAPPGVVKNWEFVDGIPDNATPDNPLSSVRGGVTDKGDDVGRYTSIVVDRSGDPIIAYYDATHGALKYAQFGAVRWHVHTVDKGTGMVAKGGDDIGKYASMTLDKDGKPGIAYYAEVAKGQSGMRESQLRFAQAKTQFPSAASDWTVTVIETRPMPVPMMGAQPPELPDGIALFCASARKGDGAPVIAYYDRERGNLRYVEYDAVAKSWGKPEILDGEDAMGGDTADVGQYPSVTVDGAVTHISYVDATHDNLLYVNTKDKMPTVVDDGYHPKDEMTLDGLDAPVWHLVGDSSSIQVLGGKILIAYQDSTVLQLKLAVFDPMAMPPGWTLTPIAGHATPFAGSYGFYAQNRLSGGVAILSSYAIDQHHEVPLFYVETFAVDLGTIM